MGTYSFVKSVRRSQSDVSICHIRISGCVCYNSAQISLIRTPSKRKPVTHFVECVQRLQYLNQLFRNLCQRYEVRLWHVPFNQFHTVWINYAPCLRDFMQTKIVCDQKSCCARWESNLFYVLFMSVPLPCFSEDKYDCLNSFPPRDGFKPWPEGRESPIRDPFWQKKLSDFPVVGVIRAKVYKMKLHLCY